MARVGAAFGSPFYEEFARKKYTKIKNDNNVSDSHWQPLQNAGITLIALIITIIILLILAGVAIHFTLGENGILRNAETAGAKYSEASVKETIQNILADMQMEEIKNGRKLDLAKVAQNLESKDNNIAITEYEEGAKELKGTYTINGQEYEFTINNKFEIEVKESTGEKIVKIEEIKWENGKPKVTLTSNQEGTIEYKDENGEWKPYSEDVNVKEGDTLTVRVKTGAGTTKEETIVIKDKTAPTEFTIEIASEFIKSKTVTVNLKTMPVDNETGLKDYTYVAETNGSKKEITNVTATSYQITELEPETSYTVYVLAYDNAGNYRKSNAVTITTPAYIPPTVDVGTTHTIGHNLDDPEGGYYYSWDEIEALAKIISDNYHSEDEELPAGTLKINYLTPEVTINMDGNAYTLGAGDYKNIIYTEEDEEGNKNVRELQVRILGFNHDLLATEKENEDGSTSGIAPQYGSGSTNTYAGISFEFVDFIMNARMNSTNTDVGGWGVCELRIDTLRTDEIINKISIANKIKEVTKEYNVGNREKRNESCSDKLWLLASSEVWPQATYNNGYYIKKGYYTYCNTKEGEQYAFYREIGYRYDINVNSGPGIKPSNWWLRSPASDWGQRFCFSGYAGSGNAKYARESIGIAPGFCI